MDGDFIFLAHLYSLRYFPKNPFDSFKEIVGRRSLDDALEFVFKGNGISYKYTDENSRRMFLPGFFPDNNESKILLEVGANKRYYDPIGKIFSKEYHEGDLSDSLIVKIVEDNPLGISVLESIFSIKFKHQSGLLGMGLIGFKGLIAEGDDTELHEALKGYISKVRKYYSLLNHQGISFEDFYKSMSVLREKDDDAPQITYDGSLNA